MEIIRNEAAKCCRVEIELIKRYGVFDELDEDTDRRA
jgi:hypothetical protein